MIPITYPFMSPSARGKRATSERPIDEGMRFRMLMKYLSTPTSPITSSAQADDSSREDTLQHRTQIQLSTVRLSKFDLKTLEARRLYQYLHKDETITAAMNGWTQIDGFAMLVATSRRIIWLKVRPLFSTCDDISYEMVSAVSANTNKWFASVTLHAGTS